MATKIESLHGGEFDEKMRKIQEMESLSNKMQGMYEDLEKKTMDVSRMMPHNIQDEVTQLRAEMQHAISRMQNQAVSKSVDQIEILKKRISDMEDSIQSIHEAARVQPLSSNLYDDQISELLQRILLLESRLAAFENMIERTQQMQSYQDTSPRPIILE
jgi:DNA-binding protein